MMCNHFLKYVGSIRLPNAEFLAVWAVVNVLGFCLDQLTEPNNNS